MVFNLILLAVFVFAVTLVFRSPAREVTQPPEKMQRLWELVAPGTSPAWDILGSFALIAWIYFVVQDVLYFWKGTRYIVTSIAMPNLYKAYGIPGPTPAIELLRQFFNPSWIWIYLAPAVLFAVNVGLVFRDKIVRTTP